jgi:DNA-binding Lrp family transcriptional regulator
VTTLIHACSVQAGVGQSNSVVRRRCQALFQAGVVRAEVVVNRVSTDALVMAVLGIQASRSVSEVGHALAAFPEVEILIRCSGRFSVVAEVACTSTQGLVDLADQRMLSIEAIHTVQIYPYVRIEKLPFAWSFQNEYAPAERVDQA